MKQNPKTSVVLVALIAGFLTLAVAFHFNLWGHQTPLPEIPLVDTNFLSLATARVSAAELFSTPGPTHQISIATAVMKRTSHHHCVTMQTANSSSQMNTRTSSWGTARMVATTIASIATTR